MARNELSPMVTVSVTAPDGKEIEETLDLDIDSYNLAEDIAEFIRTLDCYDGEEEAELEDLKQAGWEWDITDVDDIPGWNETDFNLVKSNLDSLADFGRNVAKYGTAYALLAKDDNDLDLMGKDFESRYYGEFKNVKDFGFSLVEEDIPEHLQYCFDFERYGEDALTDYVSIEAEDGALYVYRA